MSSNNSACVRTARKNAPSYKPTADRLCKAVSQLKKDVAMLETEVDANTACIAEIKDDSPSVISFSLDSDVPIPDTTLTLIDNWNVLEATNEFSASNYNAGFFTAPSSGIYYVTANSLWAETTITTAYPIATYININDNPSPIANGYFAFNNAVTESFSSQVISVPIPITMGDTISIQVGQESAVTVTLSSLNGTTSWSIAKY